MHDPWIRTNDQLAEFIGTLAGCRALALDTESDSLYHHREKVCLIQLAPRGGTGRLIDPLALRDLAPLGRVLADPRVVTVLHGADYDVTTLKRDCGFAFARLFDTMIAARFLGMKEFGLQAVVRAELGIELTKGRQKDDWSRRPLGPGQERYALGDVEHLVLLGERLGARLLASGRMHWAREECDAVAALPPAQRRHDPAAWQRLPGAAALPPRALAVLRELHAWREGRAEATDRPPFRVLQGSTLLTLATAAPRTLEELAQAAPEAHRLGPAAPSLFEAVARGLAVPEAALPELPQLRQTPVVPVHLRARVAALKAVRVREAELLGLDPGLVLPQRLLLRLAEAAPRTGAALLELEGLRRWRIEAFGPALLDALRGA